MTIPFDNCTPISLFASLTSLMVVVTSLRDVAQGHFVALCEWCCRKTISFPRSLTSDLRSSVRSLRNNIVVARSLLVLRGLLPRSRCRSWLSLTFEPLTPTFARKQRHSNKQATSGSFQKTKYRFLEAASRLRRPACGLGRDKVRDQTRPGLDPFQAVAAFWGLVQS